MKGVLFDLDGIVTDTATYHFSAWSRLIKDEFGLTLPEIVENVTRVSVERIRYELFLRNWIYL